MKKFFSVSKRFLSFLLTFMIVFSLVSDIIVVHAAPSITNVRFIRTVNAVTKEQSGRLYIYGSGFLNPFVRVGATGTIPAAVNQALSNSYTIVVDDTAAIAEMEGKENIIRVTTENPDGSTAELESTMDLSVMPGIEGISSSKAYVGMPLTIRGSKFDELNPSDPAIEDNLYVAGTRYNLGTEYNIVDGIITDLPAYE